MKTFLLASAIILLSFTSYSQEATAPEYLIKQDFPDSVQQVLLTTLKGESVSFSEMLKTYKGKKVLIDFWASWCGDCIGGLPKVKELQKTMSTEDVVYVFLSFDKEEIKWMSAIDRYDINGEHFLVKAGWKNPLSNYVVLDWIPRYIVLDEKGKVVLPKAVVADDKRIIEALRSAVEI
jgi:thiol-disulfide isomerase/thioredoxin